MLPYQVIMFCCSFLTFTSFHGVSYVCQGSSSSLIAVFFLTTQWFSPLLPHIELPEYTTFLGDYLGIAASSKPNLVHRGFCHHTNSLSQSCTSVQNIRCIMYTNCASPFPFRKSTFTEMYCCQAISSFSMALHFFPPQNFCLLFADVGSFYMYFGGFNYMRLLLLPKMKIKALFFIFLVVFGWFQEKEKVLANVTILYQNSTNCHY